MKHIFFLAGLTATQALFLRSHFDPSGQQWNPSEQQVALSKGQHPQPTIL